VTCSGADLLLTRKHGPVSDARAIVVFRLDYIVNAIQGLPLTPNGPQCGFLCITAYQSYSQNLYLLVGAAGPNMSAPLTYGVELNQNNSKYDVTLNIAATVTVFLDQVVLNIASESEQTNPSELAALLTWAEKSAKKCIKTLFAIITA
jgi:hypothetical protein